MNLVKTILDGSVIISNYQKEHEKKKQINYGNNLAVLQDGSCSTFKGEVGKVIIQDKINLKYSG